MTIKQQGGIFGRNPTFNDVEIEGTLTTSGSLNQSGDFSVDTDTFFVNTTTDRVGVGTNSPSYKLDVVGNSATNVDALRLLNDNTTAGVSSSVFFENYSGGGLNQGRIKYLNFGTNNSNSFVFEQEINGVNSIVETMRINHNGNVEIKTGNLIIGTSGKGIDFSATSDASGSSSELFDDYEEGTWTPAFTTTGTDFSSITYDTQSGHYTKVGRLVTARGFIRTDAITVGSASGSVLISGLPYTSTSPAVGSVAGTYNWGGDVPLSVTMFNSATTLYMYYRTSVNGIDSTIAPSDMGTGANNNDIYFTISYMAS